MLYFATENHHHLDHELLKDLLDKVAHKFGYTEPELWQDGLFVSLSEEIEKETRFIISRNTLKRLFGKIKTSEHYNPQIETRNALARYAGFPDWNKFRMQIIAEKGEQGQLEPAEVKEPVSEKPKQNIANPPKRKPNLKPILWALGFLSLIFLVVKMWPEKETDFTRIKVQVTNPIDTAPFTLVVNYEIPEDIKDSVFLGVGGTRYLLQPNKTSFVHSLSKPIYSFIYLRTSSKMIRAIPIKAYSRDMECYYESNKKVLQIPTEGFRENGLAGLKRSFFTSNRLDSSDFTTTFLKVKDYAVDADNFNFTCRYKVDKSPNICHFFQLKIFADSGHHEVEVHNKGCGQYNFVAPGELFFGGKFENLTALSAEPGIWHDFEMKVINKEFRLFIDGKQRFTSKYKRTMGMINVVKFQFNGFGQIDYFRMKDGRGQIIEKDEF